MRLLACPDCHTQFDVTEVSTSTFTCRCGRELRNEKHQPVDAKIHRCGACGASVAGAEGLCGYCGSEIVGDPGDLSLICPECYARCAEAARFCTACGVGFQPEEVRLDGYELPCPVCSALMPPQRIGDIGLNECTRCRGLWVPGEAFDTLLARAIETQREAEPEERLTRKPRATGSNPAQQAVAYRKCPECQAFMLRRNFRKSSGVIVDTCNSHGTWLDADELEQIAGFILSGTETSAVLLAEERGSERAYQKLRAERRLEHARTPGTIHTRESRAAGTLFEIFADLFDLN
ncbi:MAG: zf-TFIIB domain-containing protein [Deltaproteobacteria bacterium]|nr:zf-TFIIB domain-containing protein [Deltaproteobacteria bacterium]MBW2361033.1 zf-TFIIB domain-containing protein [Deltaproteobacteria bacterium]